MKDYFLTRWKDRWPSLAVVAFVMLGFCAITPPQKLRATVIWACIFAAIFLLFPFRWNGEVEKDELEKH